MTGFINGGIAMLIGTTITYAIFLHHWHMISTIIYSLGNNLMRNVPMDEALINASKTIKNRKLQKTLENSANGLRNGESIENISLSKNLMFIPNYTRAILASSLSNENKGKLLCFWNKSQLLSGSEINQYYSLALAYFAGFLLISTLCLTILPQQLSMLNMVNIECSFLIKSVIFINSYPILMIIALLLFFYLTVAIFKFIVNNYFDLRSEVDYCNFFKLLSIIEFTELMTHLPLFANKAIFPHKRKCFSLLMKGIKSGCDPVDAGIIAGFDPFYLWFLKLGLVSDNSKVTLKLAIQMLESRLVPTRHAILSIGYTILVLSQGIVVALFMSTIFRLMAAVLETNLF